MGLLALLAGAMALGAWVTRRWTFASNTEKVTLRMYTGIFLVAPVLLLAASLHSIALAYWLLVVLGGGMGLIALPGAFREVRTWPRPGLHDWTFIEFASLGVTATILFFALISAIAPATGWDACVAHLALPSDYLRTGRIQLMPGNAYTGFPHLLHTLFAVMMMDARLGLFSQLETSPQLLNWVFAVMACTSAYALGARLHSRKAGLIAMAIFATAPVFMDQAGTASLDLAFAGATLAVLTCFVAWRQDDRLAWLILGGLIAGASCGIRHTGYVLCVFMGIGIVFAGRKTNWFRPAALFGVLALAGAGPWLIRSAILVGNPVFPFFLGLFPTHGVDHPDLAALATHETVRTTRFMDLLTFPWDLIMDPEHYDGWSKSPGGVLLALAVPGFFVSGKPARVLWLFAAAGFVCFFFFQQYARYMLPFFAALMVVAALAACDLPFLKRTVLAVLLVSFAYGLIVAAGGTYFKIPVVLGLESREDYLQRRVERYEAFAWVNEYIPKEDVVLTFDMRTFYLDGPTYQNLEAMKVLAPEPFERQLQWLQARGIRYMIMPYDYLLASHNYMRYEMKGVRMMDMFERWRHLPKHFELIHTMELSSDGGMDRVEIYRIHYGDEGRYGGS